MHTVNRAYDASMRDLATPELTRVLETAMQQHQPPVVRGRRIKLRYAHQGGRNPPVIVVHGNQVQHVPEAYRRYLAGVFRKNFRLEGTPVRVEFRSDENPFKGRRNELTPRQVRSPHDYFLCWKPGTLERWECAAFVDWLRLALA